MGGALDKRVAAFEQQERSNPLLAAYFHENFALEFALASARKYRRSTGRLPKGAEYDQLYGFLIPAQRIHSALPASAKAPFEGRLRHALNAPHGLRSFAYEISIATHLMQRNWDVVFMDPPVSTSWLAKARPRSRWSVRRLLAILGERFIVRR